MKLRRVNDEHRAFRCPGCGDNHMVRVKGVGAWTWNGDMDKPTFRPSILARTGHYVSGHEEDCWCAYYEANPDEQVHFKCCLCHSYVTDGKIRFLGDCSHDLAGQTVEIPEWNQATGVE